MNGEGFAIASERNTFSELLWQFIEIHKEALYFSGVMGLVLFFSGIPVFREIMYGTTVFHLLSVTGKLPYNLPAFRYFDIKNSVLLTVLVFGKKLTLDGILRPLQPPPLS